MLQAFNLKRQRHPLGRLPNFTAMSWEARSSRILTDAAAARGTKVVNPARGDAATTFGADVPGPDAFLSALCGASLTQPTVPCSVHARLGLDVAHLVGERIGVHWTVVEVDRL